MRVTKNKNLLAALYKPYKAKSARQRKSELKAPERAGARDARTGREKCGKSKVNKGAHRSQVIRVAILLLTFKEECTVI